MMKSFSVMAGAVLSLSLMAVSCVDDVSKTNNASTNNGTTNNGTTNNGTTNNGVVHWDDCTITSECILTANSCCGVCGVPSAEDMDAVNISMTAEHRLEVCPVEMPCPACPTAPNPNLVPICEDQKCKVLDVAASDYASCEVSEDCTIRAAECCECGFNGVVALNVSRVQDYEAAVCDPTQECLACEPDYSQFEGDCVEGRCVVNFLE